MAKGKLMLDVCRHERTPRRAAAAVLIALTGVGMYTPQTAHASGSTPSARAARAASAPAPASVPRYERWASGLPDERERARMEAETAHANTVPLTAPATANTPESASDAAPLPAIADGTSVTARARRVAPLTLADEVRRRADVMGTLPDGTPIHPRNPFLPVFVLAGIVAALIGLWFAWTRRMEGHLREWGLSE